jgi:signal transduction histidine kinase
MRMDLLGWLVLAGVTATSAGLLRRWPLLGLAVLLAGSPTLGLVPGPSREVLFLPVLLTGLEVCFIAATQRPLISIAAAAMPIGLAATQRELVFGNDSPAVLTAFVAVTVIAWLAGHSIRQGHVNAERLRAQAQAQQATNERLRLARELHDMVAHSIGVIAIQAGAGRRVIDSQPAEARNALDAIEATSRETLAGLRRMLTTLRQAGPAGDPVPSPLEPAPGLADLGRLTATTQDAGVRVEVRWRGQRRPLPAEVDLSAFRIIQEALTNVVRHADASHCQVAIDQQDEELSIEVTDDGRGGADAGAAAGYGITGMRERASLLGGQFAAGPRPAGGFRVVAALPVPAAVLPVPAAPAVSAAR